MEQSDLTARERKHACPALLTVLAGIGDALATLEKGGPFCQTKQRALANGLQKSSQQLKAHIRATLAAAVALGDLEQRRQQEALQIQPYDALLMNSAFGEHVVSTIAIAKPESSVPAIAIVKIESDVARSSSSSSSSRNSNTNWQ